MRNKALLAMVGLGGLKASRDRALMLCVKEPETNLRGRQSVVDTDTCFSLREEGGNE